MLLALEFEIIYHLILTVRCLLVSISHFVPHGILPSAPVKIDYIWKKSIHIAVDVKVAVASPTRYSLLVWIQPLLPLFLDQKKIDRHQFIQQEKKIYTYTYIRIQTTVACVASAACAVNQTSMAVVAHTRLARANQ